MNGIVIVKGALYTLSGMGTKAIVHTVLKPYIPVDVNAIQKVAYTAAEFGLAGCAAAKTGEFWVKSIDEMIAVKNLVNKKIKEATKEELKKPKKESKVKQKPYPVSDEAFEAIENVIVVEEKPKKTKSKKVKTEA